MYVGDQPGCALCAHPLMSHLHTCLEMCLRRVKPFLNDTSQLAETLICFGLEPRGIERETEVETDKNNVSG